MKEKHRLVVSYLALLLIIISYCDAKVGLPSKRGTAQTGNSNNLSMYAENSASNRGRRVKPKRQVMFFPNQPTNDPNSQDTDNEDDGRSDSEAPEASRPTNSGKAKKRTSSYQNSRYEDDRLHTKVEIKRSPPFRKTNQYFKGRDEMMNSYFMRTTAFVHGDTFLGLGRTTSGILFGYFATMYCLYVLSTTLLLFQRRKDPSLSKFPLWMSHFAPAAMNAMIVVLGFTRHMFRARYPCFIVLWTYGLLTPMYVVMIFEARSLNLIFEYHWNKRMQSLLQASEPRSIEGDSNSPPIIVLDKSSNKKGDSHQFTNNEDWLWIKKHGMVATIIGIFIFQFLMTFSIQMLSPYYRIWPKMMVYRCAGTIEGILPSLALIMYMFVIPLYLFIQLKRINDSYGVRKDIYSAVTQSAWVVILFSIIRHVFFIEKFIGYVPTGFAVLTTFGVLHYHTVCAPLLRIYVWQWSRSRVKRRVRKLLILKRRIEAIIFPRFFRIRIDNKKSSKYSGKGGHGGQNPGNTLIKAPEPIKASKSNEIRKRPRSSYKSGSNNPEATPKNFSPADSRSEHLASPTASMSPMTSPDMKIPTFNQVLQDEILCELFERYTLLEFSRENLLFYRAVCSLRSTYSTLPQGAAQIFLVEKSRSLASQFIHINAPAEINIPGPVRKRIEDRLAELDVDLTLFDEAQREVFRLMQNWSYPRFLRTLPEAEIRRFNRKARRNSTTAQTDNSLLSFSAAISQNVNIPKSQAVAIVSQSSLLSSDSNQLLATSVSSLTLPLNIAEVSLSSSP